jgi:DNA-binding transcriptional ArsR family regulator
MFKDIFGDSPQTKILDFLADYPRFDYSISEISDKAGVSRPTVYKVLKLLSQKKLVIKTREQGNSSLFQLNLENRLVQLMLKFDFELADKVAEIESQDSVKKYMPTLVKSNYKTRNKKVVVTN